MKVRRIKVTQELLADLVFPGHLGPYPCIFSGRHQAAFLPDGGRVELTEESWEEATTLLAWPEVQTAVGELLKKRLGMYELGARQLRLANVVQAEVAQASHLSQGWQRRVTELILDFLLEDEVPELLLDREEVPSEEDSNAR
jgi:hypothetical protein